MTGKSSLPATAPHKGSIEEALRQVATEGRKFLDGDEKARERLLMSARELVTTAETPVESLLWNIWALVRAVPYVESTTMLSKGGGPSRPAQLRRESPWT